ncbi:hypothetical protein HBA54_08555 [Pelagibius litoralis]|uniref:Uncharacterized protein n=1 Tax=Pelagibius litoralis TaxID=374515 RepID=A0A967C548_9PROT|nr:hypothetical protein [Pelagibius litoralis]NIA68640.1 hypothetical protein [Pelagibius litoralis]
MSVISVTLFDWFAAAQTVNPEGERLAPVFADDRVTFVTGDKIRLTAGIETPDGVRELT